MQLSCGAETSLDVKMLYFLAQHVVLVVAGVAECFLTSLTRRRKFSKQGYSCYLKYLIIDKRQWRQKETMLSCRLGGNRNTKSKYSPIAKQGKN